MAKSNNHNLPKNAKRNNRRLAQKLNELKGDIDLRIVVATENSDDFWDTYEDVEPVQRTHYELTD